MYLLYLAGLLSLIVNKNAANSVELEASECKLHYPWKSYVYMQAAIIALMFHCRNYISIDLQCILIFRRIRKIYLHYKK